MWSAQIPALQAKERCPLGLRCSWGVSLLSWFGALSPACSLHFQLSVNCRKAAIAHTYPDCSQSVCASQGSEAQGPHSSDSRRRNQHTHSGVCPKERPCGNIVAELSACVRQWVTALAVHHRHPVLVYMYTCIHVHDDTLLPHGRDGAATAKTGAVIHRIKLSFPRHQLLGQVVCGASRAAADQCPP